MTTKSQLEEKLGTANYATWCIDMKWFLVSKGLWAIVEADALPIDSEEDDLEEEAKNNGKALAVMGLNVEKFHKATIAACASAKEAWERLKAQFQAKSTARRLQLRKDLHQLKLHSSETIPQYVARGRALYDELLSIGHTIEEQEVAWSVLGGLSGDYINMVTTIEANATNGELELDDIMAKLMIVEQRDGPKYGEAEAYYGNTSAKCYKCGEEGHIRRDCPKKFQQYTPLAARNKRPAGGRVMTL